MYYKLLFIVSMCNFINCSETKKEDIVLGELTHENDGHHNHWGSEKHLYNEQHREHLPEHLIHHASTSVVSQRVDHGVVDLPGVKRVVSDDSIPGTTVNVAATIAVKTEAECCNSHCCIDEETTCRCAIQ
jgi:hypothetical protein